MRLRLAAYTKKGKITQRKKAAGWLGFWIKDDNELVWTSSSHQEALCTVEGGPTTYDDAFDLGWIRGYVQSKEIGLEARSLVDKFKTVQDVVQKIVAERRVDEVLIDLNSRSYSIPIEDFLKMSKSSEIRSYQISFA